MISFFLSSLSQTTFFYGGLKNNELNNINSTPFLFCNRNNFYIVDVLLYLNNFKRILFFLQFLFLKKNNIVILYEKENISYFFSKKLEKLDFYLKNFKKIFKMKKNQKNYKFLIYNLLLKKIYINSNYYFFDFFSFYMSSLRFFRSKDINNLLKLSSRNFFNFFKKPSIFYNKKLLRKNYLKKYDYNIFLNNFNFYNVFLESYKINKKNLYIDDLFLLVLTKFGIFYKFFNLFLYSYNLIKYNFLNSNFYKFLDFLNKFKNNYKNFNKFFLINFIKKNLSLNRIIYIYKRILSLKFFLFNKIKQLEKWLVLRSLNSNDQNNIKYKFILNKLKIFYNYIKTLNKNILYLKKNQKNINFLAANFYSNKNFSHNFISFYSNKWQSGNLTNFYGVKNSFSELTIVPNFFFLIYLKNYESFLKEVSFLNLPMMGILDITGDLNYFQYHLLTNNSDWDLNFFYYNMILESYIRSYLIDLNRFTVI
jgi:ribosomal protein S2